MPKPEMPSIAEQGEVATLVALHASTAVRESFDRFTGIAHEFSNNANEMNRVRWRQENNAGHHDHEPDLWRTMQDGRDQMAVEFAVLTAAMRADIENVD